MILWRTVQNENGHNGLVFVIWPLKCSQYMLRDILKNIFHLLPDSFQLRFRKRQYLNWEKSGKSIPPPQVVKLFKIQELQETYSCDTFIETGTYKGDMLFALKNYFSRLISVELSAFYYQKALVKFKKHQHVELLFGDSGELMPVVIKNLKSPAIFWLDGHFSSGDTAQ